MVLGVGKVIPKFKLTPLVLSLFLGACDGPFSTLTPYGATAESVSILWWIMLIGAIAIFIVMMILFFWVMCHPQSAKRIKSKHWIIYGGLVFPGLVLLPLVVFALIAGERILPFPNQNVTEIHAEAFQWGWNFTYPDQGNITIVDLLYLPQGEPVDLHITSRDVIHSFWVPQLGGKMDAIPGKTNVMRIKANKAGNYQGLCSEFCGVGHTIMRFSVNVIPSDEITQELLERGTDE